MRHSRIAEGRPLRWTIIANGTAGGFTIAARRRVITDALLSAKNAALSLPVRDGEPSKTAINFASSAALGGAGFVVTDGPGAALEIARTVIKEAALPVESGERPFFLLVAAGGDGTSRDIETAVFEAPASLRDSIGVLRLPFGTGNDGAESHDMGAALKLLTERTVVRAQGALRLTTARQKSYLAFNVLSIGLDAFVTMMTSRMKKKFAFDMYKVWVDITALFYDKIYKVGMMDIEAVDGNGARRVFKERTLLMAMGESGHRTYGQQKRILPDERNVCLVRQMSTLRKVALKGHFTTGTHIDKPECQLFNARKVVFRGEFPILAQMDGEAVLLETADYPASIELIEGCVPCFFPR